jgi:hypothetical protein
MIARLRSQNNLLLPKISHVENLENYDSEKSKFSEILEYNLETTVEDDDGNKRI